MVVTQNGAVGVAVANHVTEELSAEFVTVPTRHQHMAGEIGTECKSTEVQYAPMPR